MELLTWALVFFIVAIIAGLFGFTNIAGTSNQIAKILFFVFIVLFILAIVSGRLGNIKLGIQPETTETVSQV